MDDPDALAALLTRFFAHERAEIADFNRAVKQFAVDLPHVLDELRRLIAEKHAASSDFAAALAAFLDHARDAINPAVTEDDVREMLIQHVLTEDIFAKVFDNPDFHRQNNVAAELYKLEGVLFGYGEKQRLLRGLQPYYAGISRAAAVISSHGEKQGFLKALYENFYKVYNPKAADRLGVVYTPGEIVRFMIRSADWLVEKHWGRNLIDPGVEILDPATGTGTFVVELLEHFRGDHAKLRHKYKEELHANEIGILPYYVANLNIEATYQAITGQFAEYPNLCLVDTLDNVAALGIYAGHQHDLLASLSDENMERVKRQNRRKISVIIGNPPYNANQQNENDNNKNRTYARVDQRIKATYIKASTAQKTKLYDMYARFFRWATDRLGDEGVLAFVTNRSFIDSRTFDGFRKLLVEDFQDIWIVDLGGDVRANPKLSGTKNNVFGIQTGVAIAFLVRRKERGRGAVRYVRRPEMETAENKLSWLQSSRLEAIECSQIKPDTNGDWLQQRVESDWDNFVPVADMETKAADEKRRERAIFKLYSLGVVTARDDWVYGSSDQELDARLPWFIERYEAERARLAPLDRRQRRATIEEYDIKLTRALKDDLAANRPFEYDPARNRTSLYRPFVKQRLHYWSRLNEMPYQTHRLFPDSNAHPAIMISGAPAAKPPQVLATEYVPSYDALEKTQTLARYRYTKSGERLDNITDWALAQFRKQYGKTVTKDAIFAYVYAVLHDPVYRETYALNLRREFPRVPMYPDFARWAAWGEALMRLHIGYEQVEPWPLARVDAPDPKRASGTHPKPVLRSDPALGVVRVDADTQLTGVPAEAWRYRLGNRSAIDWVLDQHKEKTPRDPTIRERFNSYRFADHKEAMIDLLARVVRVSMETTAITEAMRGAARQPATPG